jgi:hypothetical protein
VARTLARGDNREPRWQSGRLKALASLDDIVPMRVHIAVILLLAASACTGATRPEDSLRPELERSRRDVERLRADIREAEEALIAIESGLKGMHTRAEAVSALADSRILVERAAKLAPWRENSVREAREKLDEADRHIQAGHFGSAMFFTSRARRIASTLTDEAETFRQAPKVRYVNGAKANLRSEPSARSTVLEVLGRETPVIAERNGGRWVRVQTPSGKVGWVHATLLAEQE